MVAEIAGLAGSGKTTLAQALCQLDNRIHIGIHPPKWQYVPGVTSQSLLLLPIFLRGYRHDRWFDWKETKAMVHLKLWYQLLNQRDKPNGRITLFDHGPIFWLVRLREFGPEITKSPVYVRWWENTMSQWVPQLDLYVWLDAPNEVLLKRIADRNSPHRVKGKSESEVNDFLDRYRKSYTNALSRLRTGQKNTVLCFNTDQESVDQIVEKVFVAIAMKT